MNFMMQKYLILLFLMINNVHAAVSDKAFSADAMVTIPGEPKTISKLFVGKDRVRTEVTTQNGVIVDIVFPMEGKLIKLNPQLKQFIEIPIAKQTHKQQSSNNPCYRLQHATCTQLGEENINGMNTQKWKIISLQQGKNVRTLHWVDTQRQLAIREFFNDGSMAEMVLEKNETMNNRKTEKWVRTLSRPDGSTVNSYQWYDPQLNISIREELPGGYIRELKNIKVGKQKNSLFVVPDDYSPMKPQGDLPHPSQSHR